MGVHLEFFKKSGSELKYANFAITNDTQRKMPSNLAKGAFFTLFQISIPPQLIHSVSNKSFHILFYKIVCIKVDLSEFERATGEAICDVWYIPAGEKYFDCADAHECQSSFINSL